MPDAPGTPELPPSTRAIERLESKVAELIDRLSRLEAKLDAGEATGVKKELAEVRKQLDDAKQAATKPAKKSSDDWGW